MKVIWILRDVGLGRTYGIYSSRAKAQAAAQYFLERWGVTKMTHSDRKLMEFFWIDDARVDTPTGIVIEKDHLQ